MKMVIQMGRNSTGTNVIQELFKSSLRQQSARSVAQKMTIDSSDEDDNKDYLKNFCIGACFPAFMSFFAFFLALLISCWENFELRAAILS
jgi:hypothetical protein